MMKKILLASTFMASLSCAAAAADAVIYEPTPEAAAVLGYDWSGLYVGAQVGYAWGDGQVGYDDEPGWFNTYYWDTDPDGFFGGLHVGYNHQFANGLVLGVESDANYGGLSSGKARYVSEGFVYELGYYDGELELDWFGSTRIRAGFAMDRWLPFVTAGVAYSAYDFSISYDGGDSGSEDGTLIGWTVGAGAEYAITDKWRIRGEYRYTDYGSVDFNTYYSDGSFYDGGFRAEVKTHDLRIGASYSF